MVKAILALLVFYAVLEVHPHIINFGFKIVKNLTPTS